MPDPSNGLSCESFRISISEIFASAEQILTDEAPLKLMHEGPRFVQVRRVLRNRCVNLIYDEVLGRRFTYSGMLFTLLLLP